MSLRCWDAMKHKFGWLAIPFVYGDIDVADEVIDTDNGADSNQECRRSRPVYNGTITSINSFFLVTSSLFAICMMPVIESKLNKNGILKNVSIHIILIAIMIAGFIVKLLFLIIKVRIAKIQCSKWFKGVDRIVYVIGLMTLYISGCLLDIFHVIAIVTCDRVWRSYEDNVYEDYIIDVMYYLTKIVYLGLSVLFTLVFYSSKFMNTCLVRYGLMFLLSTYFAIWFEMFVYQSRQLMRIEKATAQSRNLTTYCLTNYSNNISEASSNTTIRWQCITHTSPTYKMIEDYVAPICYPIAFQIFILIIERFCAVSQVARTKRALQCCRVWKRGTETRAHTQWTRRQSPVDVSAWTAKKMMPTTGQEARIHTRCRGKLKFKEMTSW